MSVQPVRRAKRFLVILIKPSHYDDEGYVIQWYRSPIPSNSLASVYGLVAECASRKALGEDVDIEVEAIDETNTVLAYGKLIRRIKAAEGGMVGLVGVQSNQFPRAVDIARQFRAAGIPVVIGGFHAAGSISMLTEVPPELREAQALGISIYAGETEGRMEQLLRDAYKGELKPLYNFMDDLPSLEGATIPFLPAQVIRKMAGAPTSFDAGRGCPFQCSFCTIINVQGRKSRFRTPDDIERLIRLNLAHGIKRFFVTDDNFARNKNWEGILDRMIDLRENQGLNFKIVLQVDTLCYRLPGFIEKAARAGCSRVFIGLENIDPDALTESKKRQNKIWEYRKMLQAWKAAGVITYAGYILGFAGDTPEKVHRDIEIIKNELPLDMIEFFFLTPLPGSEDHKVLVGKGTWMDGDLNKYDLNHRVTHHPVMSDAAWEKLYLDAWRQYYSIEHIERILRREAAHGGRIKALHASIMHFLGSVMIEGVHPLETGIFRRKIRRHRRPGLPLENPLTFYPRRCVQVVATVARWAHLYFKVRAVYNRVAKDPNPKIYSDIALQPVTDDEQNDLDIIKTFQGSIPRTHGAPVLAPRPAA